ncbi:LodA/GoxA family CTQ-dependent oxidase [Camelimonas abortus]|uniref:LodA/GoxA family CTQ-dependent oxidase n=1 Tax=Camelimonas abortus TaxID=1017184 RepID=UPI0035E6B704
MRDDLQNIVDYFVYNRQIVNFHKGQKPGLRGAFTKTHGGAYGKFRIISPTTVTGEAAPSSVEAKLRKGIFATNATYDAWVRFGSDTPAGSPDRNTTIGVGLKLFRVPGLNVLDAGPTADPSSQAATVDFVFQNYPVFFARDCRQMAAYTKARLQGGQAEQDFLNDPDNQKLVYIQDQMGAKDPDSALSESYWSCVPFYLGAPGATLAHYCKYILAPADGQTVEPATDKDDRDYIRKNLTDNLKKSSFVFNFYIHYRSDPSQSIEDASDNWTASDGSDEDPRFATNGLGNIYKIGVLTLPKQDISQRGQPDYIEQLVFNPWRTLPDNVPVGEIALARRIAYEVSAKNRLDLNGQTYGEPKQPRPAKFYKGKFQMTPNGPDTGVIPDTDQNKEPWNDVFPGDDGPDDPGGDGGSGGGSGDGGSGGGGSGGGGSGGGGSGGGGSGGGSGSGDIVRFAIHPGIGVARVGDSVLPDGVDWWSGNGEDDGSYVDCYVGPEVDTPPPANQDRVRDASGAIKRQAARFRIYAYDENNNVVREILPTDPGVSVTWSVTLANRKAQWFRFDRAWDEPTFRNKPASVARNGAVRDRASLAITPPAATITGARSRSGPMNGSFLGVTVSLGELRTDASGRLLVLGGQGKSASVDDGPNKTLLTENSGSFNNADSWYDDISDGPVHATVVMDGKTWTADPAWVIVGPPNYAPDMVGFRTLYDLLEDVYEEAGWLQPPATVSFRRDILPVLQRLSMLSWVNKGFYQQFGYRKDWDFTDPDLIVRLGAKPTASGDPYRDLRQKVLDSLLKPDEQGCRPDAWPMLYGDTFDEDYVGSGDGINDPVLNTTQLHDMIPLSQRRYRQFKSWANGDFDADYDPATAPAPPRRIDDVPVAEQPAMLDKAALHFCIADAFHPGCEVTWPIRHVSLYRAPWRIAELAAGQAVYVPDADATISYQTVQDELAAAADARKFLGAQPPGGLTRWMALPWQTDTGRCRAGYDANYKNGAYGVYAPAYWPARVPNQVLGMADYRDIMDTSLSTANRTEKFTVRQKWWRRLSENADSTDVRDQETQAQNMVESFSAMGTVLRMQGPADLPSVPETVYVEWTPSS